MIPVSLFVATQTGSAKKLSYGDDPMMNAIAVFGLAVYLPAVSMMKYELLPGFRGGIRTGRRATDAGYGGTSIDAL